MKRIFVFALAAASFAACDNQKSNETTTVSSNSDTTTFMSDTTNATTAPTLTDNTATTTSYVPAEGDVMYRDGKLMVWRSNAYVLADKDIDHGNGITVRRNGEVWREGKSVKLEDGQAVSKTGKFFNKAGEGIEDAWDATKKGANKAAAAVKKGAKKVGEEVKDAVD